MCTGKTIIVRCRQIYFQFDMDTHMPKLQPPGMGLLLIDVNSGDTFRAFPDRATRIRIPTVLTLSNLVNGDLFLVRVGMVKDGDCELVGIDPVAST